MDEQALEKLRAMTISHDDFMLEELLSTDNQALWLQIALEEYTNDGDFNSFYSSLERVVSARKLSVRKMSKDLKLNRGNIIKLLDGRTKTAPRLDTLTKILDYLDFEIRITPKKKAL